MTLRATVVVVAGIVLAIGSPHAQRDVTDNRALWDQKATLDVPNPPPGAVLVVRTILTDNGDGDGWADTNETVDMRLLVYNRTGMDLTDLVARLTTTDPKVACVSDAVIEIGVLGDRETTMTAEAFTFMVADVGRASPVEEFSVTVSIDITANELEGLIPSAVTLDLDLDAAGGAGSTVFFEGFENGLGVFTAMQLDEELNPPDDDLGNIVAGRLNADGYRCQYSDPDFENTLASNSPNNPCYPNPVGMADAFYFDVTTDRAFSGTGALYYGVALDGALGFTTPLGQLEAMRTTAPINLAWQNLCSESRSVICTSHADCPTGEECIAATPTLLFKHQISLMDHRSVGAGEFRTVDRAVVQLQIVDAAGTPTGDWIRLEPHLNGYDSEATFYYTQCFFDPIDDGNTEEDFFDPADPARLFGPSSTCFPERSFADQGDTFSPFNPEDSGDASDGPGLEGSAGLGTWIETRFDLGRFRGQRAHLRFLATSIKVNEWATYEQFFTFNPDPRDDGWFIDDVTVTDTLTEAATVAVDANDNLDIKADGDLDDVGATCDCNSGDPTAWMLPTEARSLTLSHSQAGGITVLSWTSPFDMGGTEVLYDTLGATAANDFVATGFCIEGSSVDTSSSDPTVPGPDVVQYYLVRAKHSCGNGPLGASSSGEPRAGVDCP